LIEQSLEWWTDCGGGEQGDGESGRARRAVLRYWARDHCGELEL